MQPEPGHAVAAGVVPEPAPLLPSGRLQGRELMAQLVRDALSCAAAEGWHEIIISDASFADWPLGERSVVASLEAWAKPGRRLVMLATRYDEVLRRQARFVNWRKTWNHLIDCRTCRAPDPQDFPGALWSPRWSLQRLDARQGVVLCGSDAMKLAQLRGLLNEWFHNSTPGFPATTLGL